MSPSFGRLPAAFTARECGAPGMMWCGRVGRRGALPRNGMGAVLGHTLIATPLEIVARWASWRLGLRPGWAGGHALAVAIGFPAGLEDEGRAGAGLGGDDRVLIDNDQTAIEQFARGDAAAGIGPGLGPGGDLHPAWPELHGVVLGHDAVVATAQDQLEVAGSGTPPRGGLRGRLSKAAGEIGQEARQEGIAGLEGVEAVQA